MDRRKRPLVFWALGVQRDAYAYFKARSPHPFHRKRKTRMAGK